MFSGILKELRENKNITQKELAKYLNITDRNIRYYETGDRIPSTDILEKIADYFDVSVDYLLGRTSVKKSVEKAIKEYYETSFDMKNLSPESQEDLKKYIELLKMKDLLKRNKDNNDELATLD
ncbi:MAG: helix-turn-helix domain-containing protein [Tissierellaceae bacterium]